MRLKFYVFFFFNMTFFSLTPHYYIDVQRYDVCTHEQLVRVGYKVVFFFLSLSYYLINKKINM